MDMFDQIFYLALGIAVVAALIGIPYLHIQSRKLDEEMEKRPPAE